jgi:hypothetical protein
MSFFDDASLAFLPSGAAGKDGKAYSIKPTDGTGDFTFSRGSNLAATRVGADGLIEKGRENLLLQSNQFDTTWATIDSNVTSGQSGYDGSSNAWELDATTAGGRLYQSISFSGVHTFSIYAKKGTANGIRVRLQQTAVANAYVDLRDGSLFGSDNAIDVDIQDVSNGWYRITFALNASGVSIILLYPTDGEVSQTTGSIYIQDAQLEIGLAATDYIESGATTGKAGLLEDEPRFDYSGGATCPSLLLEPSRTNQIELSEYFEDITIYDLRSADIVTNYAISPEGVQNATKVIPQNGTTNFRIQTQNTFGVSGDNVLSVFAKYESGGFQYLVLATNSVFQTYAFDIQNGTKVGNAGGATIANEDATIELIGDGWYRCSIKSNNTTNADGVIYLSDDGTSANATGDGSKGMLIYGFQGEANVTYPTSYIPNHSGGTITRGADVCTGAGDVTTFNSTEGVLYAEVAALVDAAPNRRISINSGNYTNSVLINLKSTANQIGAIIKVSNSVTIDLTHTLTDVTATNKIALKYKVNDVALWVNGVEVQSVNSFTAIAANTLSALSFNRGDGGDDFHGKTKQVLVFNTALSDADLATLTTI